MINFICRAFAFTLSTMLLHSIAFTQVTYDDVVRGAFQKNKPTTSEAPNNQLSVDQLLNNLYRDRSPNPNTYNQSDDYSNTPSYENYGRPTAAPSAPNYNQRYQQPSYNETPAGRRYRATQQQRNSSGVSANNPDAAWEAVKSSQSYGFKRKMTDLDEYSISEDDLLDPTENGVINVNNIPDSRSYPPPVSASQLPPREEIRCPEGSVLVMEFCMVVPKPEDGNQ